jgi:serine/threonine-protein kinase
VIAYRCLLGKLPFTGDSVGRLILEICSRPLPVPSHRGPVPEGFDAWFARACARDPSARFDSAKRAAAELSRLTDDAASVASEPAKPAPAQNPMALATTTLKSSNTEVLPSPRRRPRPLAIGLAAFALFSLLTAIGVQRWTSSNSAPVPPSSATPEQQVKALEARPPAAPAASHGSQGSPGEWTAPPGSLAPPRGASAAGPGGSAPGSAPSTAPAPPSEPARSDQPVPAASAPSEPGRPSPATSAAGSAPQQGVATTAREPLTAKPPARTRRPSERKTPAPKPPQPEPPPQTPAKPKVDLGI